ncbi:MAG: HDOD domain-containing protein [Gammaproteobacteria bacterium]|nr:HDOD domain-containing protein [Gammaproteobacteria bacterium]
MQAQSQGLGIAGKPGRLRFFNRFRDLDAEWIIPLASRARFVPVYTGDRLVRIGDEDPHELFLLEGALDIVGRDGRRIRLDAGTEQAREAIAPLLPRRYSVTAASAGLVVELDHAVLQAVVGVAGVPAAPVALAVPVPAPWQALYADVLDALARERLRLPTLPRVALRIRLALEDDTVGVAEIARLVSADPAMAAKFVRVANSPLYRHGRVAQSCAEAIARIGVQTARELAICFAVRDVFKAPVATMTARVRESWARAVHVAALCQVLARQCKGFNADHAMLAGLLHNIGTMPALTFAAGRAELIAEPARLGEAVAALTPALGATVLRNWDLGEDLALAAEHAGDWTYDGGRADYAALVIVAVLHARIECGDVRYLPRLDTTPAVSHIQPGDPDPRSSLALLEAARADLSALRQLFG